jgi:DnaJ-class molecular chaperone
MNQKDYYKILGVSENATSDQIKQAYRRLAFEYHPDRNKDPAMSGKMKEINEAYAVLSDVSKRREYDMLKSRYGSFAYDHYKQSHNSNDIFRGSDINQIFEEFARIYGFRSFNDIFTESYGQDSRSYEFRRPGMFGRGFIFYPGARRGDSQQQVNDSQARMPELPFSGFLGKMTKFFLKRVAGIELPERGKDWYDTVVLSPEEASNGTEVEYFYKKWGKPKNLMVKIPPNTRDGQYIRLSRMGSPGKAGGMPGDLYLYVKIKRPLMQRIKRLFGKK